MKKKKQIYRGVKLERKFIKSVQQGSVSFINDVTQLRNAFKKKKKNPITDRYSKIPFFVLAGTALKINCGDISLNKILEMNRWTWSIFRLLSKTRSNRHLPYLTNLLLSDFCSRLVIKECLSKLPKQGMFFNSKYLFHLNADYFGKKKNSLDYKSQKKKI